VIDAPGLRFRLMARGLASAGKALLDLARGNEQPMMWYEHFRYEPESCSG